ncbi:hypothetical protein [Streptomyces sp. NPDC048638]|uniref:hypothetical protein n=1 Tax=Streptomyces sp. NPDC048638 TaxID=3365580 RepID=UPI00372251C2
MARVTNHITGGVHTGTLIMAGAIGYVGVGDDGGVTVQTGTPAPQDNDAELATITAELRTELDRPGPRLAVLTRGESAVVHALLTLLEGAVLELAPSAAAVTRLLAERVAEHGQPLAELPADADGLTQELNEPGPLLAVLTLGECTATYLLLAALPTLHPGLEPVTRSLAARISARSAEFGF